MPIFDVVLVVILAGFVFYGLFFGLIRALGNFIGVVLAGVLSARFYLVLSAKLSFISFVSAHPNIGKALIFIILFFLLNRLFGFAFYLIDKVFHLITFIPFLKTFNRLLGFVFGFLAGSIFIGFSLMVIKEHTIINSIFGVYLQNSKLTPFFLSIAKIFVPLFPFILQKAKTALV